MSGEPEQAHGSSVHDESRAKQLDRNLIELLNELRVTGTGIQVLLAFLLIVPFNTGWRRVSEFDRIVYFVALLSIAVSAVLLIAPSVHHRLLFRHGQRPFIITMANRLAILGMIALAVGLVAISVLLSNFVIGETAALVVGSLSVIGVCGLWFAIPLVRRENVEPTRREL
jgi:hypothetical protein